MVSPLGLVRGGVTSARRAADVALALPRIAVALERIAGSTDDLRRIAATGDELRRLMQSTSGDDLRAAAVTLQRVADTVTQLNLAVASLNSTVSPLQGATERLGRLVDRLPQRTPRRVVDVEADPAGGPDG